MYLWRSVIWRMKHGLWFRFRYIGRRLFHNPQPIVDHFVLNKYNKQDSPSQQSLMYWGQDEFGWCKFVVIGSAFHFDISHFRILQYSWFLKHMSLWWIVIWEMKRGLWFSFPYIGRLLFHNAPLIVDHPVLNEQDIHDCPSRRSFMERGQNQMRWYKGVAIGSAFQVDISHFRMS